MRIEFKYVALRNKKTNELIEAEPYHEEDRDEHVCFRYSKKYVKPKQLEDSFEIGDLVKNGCFYKVYRVASIYGDIILGNTRLTKESVEIEIE